MSRKAHSLSAPANTQSLNYLKVVERTTDNFVSSDDTAVKDVRRILLQVRSQYDSVHFEAEQKEAKLKHIREQTRAADATHGNRAEESHRLEDQFHQLQEKLVETRIRTHETMTNKKVYEHMLARIQKEQAILKEKMLKMEGHMDRKRRELHQSQTKAQRAHIEEVQAVNAWHSLERDATTEQVVCEEAVKVMENELDRRKESNKRRADFSSWRTEVALEAANEAFNASAGRLRKLYAIEKLAGNCLQRITYQQVERSQATENGFQQIRDVTGLTDVMDIVHKFLNRDTEHEMLRASAKDAEVRLEALRQDFDESKRKTEGITFDSAGAGRAGDLYKDVEDNERMLNDALKAHEMTRSRLQTTTLQVEHMKRWANRVGQLLKGFDDQIEVQSPADLVDFFRQLEDSTDGTMTKFGELVRKHLKEGRITRTMLIEERKNDNKKEEKLLKSEQFIKNNCRVPATADGRPTSRTGGTGTEEDPDNAFALERETQKALSLEKVKESTERKRQKS
jgi:hypothetical protein